MANEKRLIDAEVVRHKINAFAASVVYRGNAEMFNGKDTCNIHEYTRGYERGILDAQKIVCGQDLVDAVEVVRCKDCKHYDNSEGICWCKLNSKFFPGGLDWHGFPEDGYCSYGERKEA